MTDAPPAKRPPGRPRAAEPHIRAQTWLTTRHYDDLCRLASTRGETLSALMRALLTRRGK